MFSILPVKDKDKLKDYPKGTTLLIYTEDSEEKGHIAYRAYKSAYEILSVSVGDIPLDGEEAFLRADVLIRSVGAIALGDGVITLCTKDDSMKGINERLGFFKNGEFYTIYLNKLFGGVCKGCQGNCGKD